MAWLKIQTSVARNKKFVKAGPAPSWLWLCGNAYCKEGLTDGFIPAEAIDFLGVKNAIRLVGRLVTAGLWEVVEGGWRVHDYLDHNLSAAEVSETNTKRGDGGKLGGRPKKNLPENLSETSEVSGIKTLPETFPTLLSSTPSAPALSSEEKGHENSDPPLDVAFMNFQDKFPSNRRKGGYLVLQAFREQVAKAGGVRAIFDALDNHLVSEQWQDAKHIPGMDTWLDEERWRQRLPAQTVTSSMSRQPAWVQKAKAAQS